MTVAYLQGAEFVDETAYLGDAHPRADEVVAEPLRIPGREIGALPAVALGIDVGDIVRGDGQ